MPGKELLLVDKAQLVGCLLGLADSSLVWDAGICSVNDHGIIENIVNEANVNTARPNWCAEKYTSDEATICSVFALAPLLTLQVASTVRRMISVCKQCFDVMTERDRYIQFYSRVSWNCAEWQYLIYGCFSNFGAEIF